MYVRARARRRVIHYYSSASVITNDQGLTLALTVDTCHWRVSTMMTPTGSNLR